MYTRSPARGAVLETMPEAAELVPLETAAASKKYSKFPHGKHKRKSCSSCHKFPSSNWKRVRKDAFPDITEYPKHSSCLSCHRRQFFGSAKPVICSICHTNASPRNSRRHPFPNPREVFDKSRKGKRAATAFQISFPHATHIEIVAENVAPDNDGRGKKSRFITASFRKNASEESCAVCHVTYKPQGEDEDEYFTKPPEDIGEAFWLKKGTFKTRPIGHTTCFTCHTADSGMSPSPQDCGTCHKLNPGIKVTDFDQKTAAPMKISDKIMLAAWRKRDSSAKFQHEFFGHLDMECATCHNVENIKTNVAATKKVKISSCAMCHVTETSDEGGSLNVEVDARKADPKFQCVKCHISYGKLPIPATHIEIIKAQAGS